jgi:predicted ATP-binding protein involved in virulence
MTVCDIARRLAIANPKTEPLQGQGIVLIDELELHLHPQWQRTVVSALQATFPNIQFLLTTHSPQVLSEVPQESIFILENGIVKKPALNNFGRDSNTILEDTMQTSKRPIKIEQFSQAYFRAINANDFEKADALKQEWIGILDKNDPIFVQGQAIITRKQLLAQ